MGPLSMCSPITYESAVKIENIAQIPDKTSPTGYADHASSSLLECYHTVGWTKAIPVPRVMVPVGLDGNGHPMGMHFLGRAGPIVNDPKKIGAPKENQDVNFLHAVK